MVFHDSLLSECRQFLFHVFQFSRERFPPGGEPHKILLPPVMFQVQSAPLGGFIFVECGVGQFEIPRFDFGFVFGDLGFGPGNLLFQTGLCLVQIAAISG